MNYQEIIKRLEAIRDSLGPFLPARETCPCPHCEGWRQLRVLLADLKEAGVCEECGCYPASGCRVCPSCGEHVSGGRQP